jgi:anti-anti-sigma factor
LPRKSQSASAAAAIANHRRLRYLVDIPVATSRMFVQPRAEFGRPSGATDMAVHRRIEVTNHPAGAGEVSMVRFLDRKIIDAANIQELGDELFALVEKEQRKNLVLNFASVEFLSSAALNKLIILDKKVKAHSGKMRLCNLKPEIYEVFAITRLNQLFDIKNTEQEALAGF